MVSPYMVAILQNRFILPFGFASSSQQLGLGDLPQVAQVINWMGGLFHSKVSHGHLQLFQIA